MMGMQPLRGMSAVSENIVPLIAVIDLLSDVSEHAQAFLPQGPEIACNNLFDRRLSRDMFHIKSSKSPTCLVVSKPL